MSKHPLRIVATMAFLAAPIAAFAMATQTDAMLADVMLGDSIAIAEVTPAVSERINVLVDESGELSALSEAQLASLAAQVQGLEDNQFSDPQSEQPAYKCCWVYYHGVWWCIPCY